MICSNGDIKIQDRQRIAGQRGGVDVAIRGQTNSSRPMAMKNVNRPQAIAASCRQSPRTWLSRTASLPA